LKRKLRSSSSPKNKAPRSLAFAKIERSPRGDQGDGSRGEPRDRPRGQIPAISRRAPRPETARNNRVTDASTIDNEQLARGARSDIAVYCLLSIVYGLRRRTRRSVTKKAGSHQASRVVAPEAWHMHVALTSSASLSASPSASLSESPSASPSVSPSLSVSPSPSLSSSGQRHSPSKHS
jgi:hypothetical protein